jgi:hypothetical protein
MQPEEIYIEPEDWDMIRRLPRGVALRVLNRIVERYSTATPIDTTREEMPPMACATAELEPPDSKEAEPDAARQTTTGRPRRAIDTAELIRLRKEGRSFPEIASRLACGVGTVHRAYRAAIDAMAPFQNSFGKGSTEHVKGRE